MKYKSQNGSAAVVLVIVSLTVALTAAVGFGGWAYNQRQHYKNDTAAIVKQEVDKTKAAQKTELEKIFAQRQKSPYKAFKGPVTYGTIAFNYPRTWSGYVDQSNSS